MRQDLEIAGGMRRSSISKQRLYSSRSGHKASLNPQFFWFMLLLLSAIGMGLVYFKKVPMSKQNFSSASSISPKILLLSLKQGILQDRRDFSMPISWFRGFEKVQRKHGDHAGPEQMTIYFPTNFPIDLFMLKTLRTIKKNQFKVIDCRENLKTKTTSLSFGLGNRTVGQILFREDNNLPWLDVYVVIIVDDFGYYDDETVQGFLDLPYPVTFSIIPGLKYSQQVAQKAIDRGFEIMIHLPMEPLHSKIERNGYTVFVGMSEKQIRQVINRACSQLPAAKGLNNHMGSKVSLDRLTLIRLMKALREKGLYFVDSMTNPTSLGISVARRMGVPAVRMNAYLDNPQSSLGAKENLELVIKKATKQGYAIAIAHARRETLGVLQAELPRWAEQGVHFIPMSQYWQLVKLNIRG